jgi:hypothetical protein
LLINKGVKVKVKKERKKEGKKGRKNETKELRFFFLYCVVKIDHLENVKLPKRSGFGDVKVRLSNIWSVSKERSIFRNLCKMRLKTI